MAHHQRTQGSSPQIRAVMGAILTKACSNRVKMRIEVCLFRRASDTRYSTSCT